MQRIVPSDDPEHEEEHKFLFMVFHQERNFLWPVHRLDKGFVVEFLIVLENLLANLVL